MNNHRFELRCENCGESFIGRGGQKYCQGEDCKKDRMRKKAMSDYYRNHEDRLRRAAELRRIARARDHRIETYNRQRVKVDYKRADIQRATAEHTAKIINRILAGEVNYVF